MGLRRASVLRTGVALWLSAAATECRDQEPLETPGPPSAGRVESVEVVPPAAGLAIGAVLQLRAILRDAEGDVVTNREVTWTSDAPAVASASPAGLVTAVAVGVAIITATSEGRSGTSEITASRVPVAAVQVTPESLTVLVGEVAQLEAVIRGASGDTLTDRLVSWSSTDSAVALAYGDGRVTGISAGVAGIVATSEGKSDTASVTVVPPPTSPWPNEPPSFRLISDQPWDAVTSLGWVLQFGEPPVIVPDPTASFSPPNVLQMVYPMGFNGGEAPSTLTHELGGVTRLYVGMWWKASSPWEGHPSNVNKIAFLFPSSDGDIYLAMYGPPGGPYHLRVLPQFPGLPSEWLVPNVNLVPVSLGQWHRIEWLLVYNTTADPANGIVRWWLDGKLIGDYLDVPFPSGAMSVFKVAPTWGGVGQTKTEVDYFWYDHVRLSGK